MTYCTHCGKPSSKKVCIHCGVKRNDTHNFCEWCGNQLEDRASICPQCRESVKNRFASTMFLAMDAITAAIYAFLTIVVLYCDMAVFSALILVLGFVLALPSTHKQIKAMTLHKKGKRVFINIIRTVLLVILWFIAFLVIPNNKVSATIIDNYGDKLEKAAVNLTAEYNDNSVQFDEQYLGASITVSGTVERVDHDDELLTARGKIYQSDVYHIFLKEGWKIDVIGSEHPEVIDLQKGDKVQISSQIEKGTSSCIILSYYRLLNQSVIIDYTTIELDN